MRTAMGGVGGTAGRWLRSVWMRLGSRYSGELVKDLRFAVVERSKAAQ